MNLQPDLEGTITYIFGPGVADQFVTLIPAPNAVTNVRVREVHGKLTNTETGAASGMVAWQFFIIQCLSLSATHLGPKDYYSDGTPRAILGIIPLEKVGAETVCRAVQQPHPRKVVYGTKLPQQLRIQLLSPAGNLVTLLGTDSVMVQLVIESDVTSLSTAPHQ